MVGICKLFGQLVLKHSYDLSTFVLQPENLLLDSQENIKISDFGLSALLEQVRLLDFSQCTAISVENDMNVLLLGHVCTQGVSLLRTTCGTPNYVAPEVNLTVASLIWVKQYLNQQYIS